MTMKTTVRISVANTATITTVVSATLTLTAVILSLTVRITFF